MATLIELQSEHEQVVKNLKKIQKQVSDLLAKQEDLQDRKSLLELEIERRQSSSSSEVGEHQWTSEDFPWSEELKIKLRAVFGMKEFRPTQLEVINATLSNRDVILIMSTGGGKSLCYQLPAIVSKGLTLVISPLISLMQDQITNLRKFGINAQFLNADSPKETVKTVHQEMVASNPSIKLLYVTPEKVSKSKRFMAQLEKCYKAVNLSRIAIDEVHCASQWGNDFRPDYKILGILKRQFPNTPVLGLTATSTYKVTADTKKMLNIPFALVFKTPLNRTNLFYDVRIKANTHDAVITDMATAIKTHFANKSGIIYCFSRKNCSDVSDGLNKLGIKSAAYHAYLPPEVKSQVHHKWTNNRIQVICATVAFGMGIDKPDVRFVFHHSISKSVENYYQESGRAGRDGKPALCLIYFGFADIFRQSSMVLTERMGLENLYQMIKYCQDLNGCRRSLIARHFGESWDSLECNGMCDCCSKLNATRHCDITEQCRALLEIVTTAESKGDGNRLTGVKLIDSAAGRGKNKTTNKSLKELRSSDVQRIITHMLSTEYLREDFHFTPYSTISYLVPGTMSSFLSERKVEIDMPLKGKSNNASDIYSQALLKKTGKTETAENGFVKAPEMRKDKKRKHESATIHLQNTDVTHSRNCKRTTKCLKTVSSTPTNPIVIDDSD